MKTAIALAERGWVPDLFVRQGIRKLLQERLEDLEKQPMNGRATALLEELRKSPIAIHVASANEQHYELPAALFEQMLGPRLKYSSCLWPDVTTTLTQAEECMLRVTCERAQITDGMKILELGCGWGSLALWIAERFPKCQILAVSNSSTQRLYIERSCRQRGFRNIRIVTADINDFDPAVYGREWQQFDRVVSIEMFEHLRNYEAMFSRIHHWLRPDGRLFLHIFCHRQYAYPFDAKGDGDWMARYFFTGGLMPSEDLFQAFASDLEVEERWRISGGHYAKTLLAWLKQFDDRRAEVLPILRDTYGSSDAKVWLYRWRMFLLACAELFGYRNGDEWGVCHYRLRPITPD